MIKRTITYTDFNGTSRTEDFYFHFRESEILELEMGTTGGLSESLQRIIQSKNEPAIVETFKELVAKAYGIKSPDGRSSIKNKDVLDAFIYTDAYSKLFMELATDDVKAANFVEGIMPSSMISKIKDGSTTNLKPVK